MGGCSDPERGPGPGRGCGLLHDDCGVPHPEVGIELSSQDEGSREQNAQVTRQARPGWEPDCSFFPRVQCLALGLAEGTELYRPLTESHKVGGLQPKTAGKMRPGCFLTL